MGTTYHVIAHKMASSGEEQKQDAARIVEEETELGEKSAEKDPGTVHYESISAVGAAGTEKGELVARCNNGYVPDDEAAEQPITNGTPPPQYDEDIKADSPPTYQEPRPAKKQPGILDTMLVGFSCIHNGAKILNTEQAKGSLSALNGIRVLSMWWVILGHSYYFMLGYYDNIRYVLYEWSYSFLFSAVVNASVAVDTFFFLSGLLVSYLTLKQLKKGKGRLNWGLFYLHRFVRITPAYMVCIGIWASLAIHFGTGTDKVNLFEGSAYFCREYWWTNILYINNLYPFPGDTAEQCLGWSWYLANDMQFYIISPFIVYLLYKNAKWGMGLILTLCFASFGVTAYLSAYYGSPVGLLPAYNNRTLVEFGKETADVIYGKPYCRIPAYLVGVIFGYIFYKVNGRPVKINKAVNLLLWFLSTAVALAIVYGPYRREGGTMPQYAAVLYTVFSRPAFVMAVGWVAFACTMGYGGPVNALLSWGFWAPLSRITFGAYLVHPITMYSVFTSANTLYHFTWMESACLFIAHMVIAYAAAFLLSIGVEGPIMGLEKALLGGRGGTRTKKK